MGRLRRPPTEFDLTLRQADQARADFAAIEDGLEFIMGQMSKVPKRRELAWVAAGSFVGGAAIANTTVTTNFIAIGQFPAATGSATAILVGPTVGVGLTRKIKGHLTASAEYRYSLYRDHTFSTGNLDSYINQTGGFLVSPVTASVRLRQSEFLLKLNYRF